LYSPHGKTRAVAPEVRFRYEEYEVVVQDEKWIHVTERSDS